MNNGTLTAAAPHLKSGALRPIGFYEKERLKEFFDVPTFSELGYPVTQSNLYGLYAPKGTREEVIKTIYKATEKIIGDHKKIIEDSLRKMSLKLDFLDPEETANKLKEEADIFRKIIKELEKSGK
jgi:tripartite-type tricarboxylate transporter receptor subunit TctC